MLTARNIALDNEILRVEVGSTLHGTGIPGHEDRDEMGICIPPPDYIVGLKQFDHYEYRSAGQGNRSGPDDLDLIIYSLRKYVGLAQQGNPSILLTLFVPDEKVEFRADIGNELMQNAHWFYSKKAAARYLGYMQSQRNGLTGEKRSGVPKRPELVEKFGYDTKYAMHAVRLGFQGVEFLQTGRITLPMAGVEGDLCRAIRHGKMTFKEVMSLIDDCEQELSALRDHPDIPDEPNYNKINEWLVSAHIRYWGR